MESLSSWAKRFARTEEYNIAAERAFGDSLLERIGELTEHFDEIGLERRDTEALISNVGYAAGLLLWREPLPPATKRKLLASLEAFIRGACAPGQSSPSCFMFWDHVVEAYEFFGSRPEDAPLREELFVALLRQAQEPGENLQLSALHGLNHLEDPRTAVELDKLESYWASEQVRQYANLARRFANP